MSINRVQKLLLSEYCDFDDMVLIESPFAQTTKEGTGMRQVHLGLTPSKLILATDVLPPVSNGNFACSSCIDPEIETFELIAIYPVECVNLSVYRRKKRQALKARFCNNRVLYFELGGFERRSMFWNLWCEKVKFFCPGVSDSSRSETSVATSTTRSSLYLVDKKVVIFNGAKQLWYKFGPNPGISTNHLNEVLLQNSQISTRLWTDKNLYLGEDRKESSLDYKPITKISFKLTKSKESPRYKPVENIPLVEEKHLAYGDNVQVNRFGSGVFEGCGTSLYLTLDKYVSPTHYSSSSTVVTSMDPKSINYDDLAETSVLIWEYYSFSKELNGYKKRHRRRYGFVPEPMFLYGLGPWNISKGERFSIQIKRAVSEVCLNTSDQKISLSISKQTLLSTTSCSDLGDFRSYRNNYLTACKKPVILFWTSGYWYRPISVKNVYNELQKHWKKIRRSQETKLKLSCLGKRCSNRRVLKKYDKEKETDEEETIFSYRKKRKYNIISTVFGSVIEESFPFDTFRTTNKFSLQHIKQLLEIDIASSSWDFDSTSIAQQLTLIDRDLFLKIPSSELYVLFMQGSSRNAPNIAAIIAFSHRISCLIASEILRDDTEKIRARLVSRFINVASKCHRLSNFQSCRSVLCGLQNPSIFRLRKTWAYVRKKHASKYQTFEYLCRLYRDPRMPLYQKTFFILSQGSHYLPYVGHIICKLLDKIPEYKISMYQKSLSRQTSLCTSKSIYTDRLLNLNMANKLGQNQNIFSRIMSMFLKPNYTQNTGGDMLKLNTNSKQQIQHTKKNKRSRPKGLFQYYKPLDCYEDRSSEGLLVALEILEKGQVGAMKYTFSSNESLQNFLLKARYNNEKKNFFNSLELESFKTLKLNNK
ncbi:uncharacterized protein LOC115882075 isoform X2 [Sitophilus oryzae]|uniref:Uncharacterized protein LOC115882075 isoform X2 n=1 Tax=Sitophilus oryzae TaxID=7048 RepID=A0A6J2XYP0_SITOR|nr:uncharacterized protein LOC115882075 isoform X2 [Sitophilus oryzae]